MVRLHSLGRLGLLSTFVSSIALGAIIPGEGHGDADMAEGNVRDIEAREVVGLLHEERHRSQLERRSVMGAAMWFGEFALEFALGKVFDGAVDDDDTEPPLSASDLQKFGEDLLGGIEKIIGTALADFAEERDKLHVHAFIRSVENWKPTAAHDNLETLVEDDGQVFLLMDKAEKLLSFLSSTTHSAFATPYYILTASTALQLWQEHIRLAPLIAAAGGQNNTDGHIDDIKTKAKSFADRLETHFLPRARTAVANALTRSYRKVSQNGAGRDCAVQCRGSYFVHTPSGPSPDQATSVAWGYHSKTGGNLVVKQCKSSDWTAAERSCRSHLDRGLAWFPSFYHAGLSERLLMQGDLGASLLTPDWLNVIALFRHVQREGTPEGFEPDPSKVMEMCQLGIDMTAAGIPLDCY